MSTYRLKNKKSYFSRSFGSNQIGNFTLMQINYQIKKGKNYKHQSHNLRQAFD